MKVVVSGLKPSGELHIGNYLGMIKNAVALQSNRSYERFYFIADYHALTQRYDAREKNKEIFAMAVDALACGIDPKKSIVFLQSHVAEHANLAWIFNTLVSMGALQRMVEYKEKVEQGEVPNAGLFDYPVLMAADILLYHAELVPAGEDQRQHVELARDIARAFNARFGKTFKEPKVLHTQAPRVMSLSDPTKKMSKSLPKGCLYLSDAPNVIHEKLRSAVTDSGGTIEYDPKNRPAIANLMMIYGELSGRSMQNVAKKFKTVGYATFKRELAELIIKSFAPIQKRRAELMKNRKQVMKILEAGAKKAREKAKVSMKEIRKKVGLI